MFLNALCLRLFTAVGITYHYLKGVIGRYYLFRCTPKSLSLFGSVGVTDQRTVLRSARPPPSHHLPSLSSSSAFFPLHEIRDGSSSLKRSSLSKSQQDSEDPRSERKRHDETTSCRQEHRTERYLESARVDRFRTSISLILAGLNASVDSWMWTLRIFLGGGSLE